MSDLIIENTAEAHLTGICEIETASFSDPWSEDSFRSALADPLIEFISAIDYNANAVAGYGMMRMFLDEGEILNIAVAEDHRRRGIGRDMMDCLISRARSGGVRNLYLEVRESNTAAKSLYESMGFDPIGIRKRYYRKPTEDAVVMCLFLD